MSDETQLPLPGEFEALGKSVREATDNLEVIEVPWNVGEVKFKTDEFTSLCPVTGQPDYNTIEIYILPDKYSIESKSLKLYLWTFRNRGVFCERLADEIAQKIFEVAEPLAVRVVVDQKPRGGIGLTARAEYQRNPEPRPESDFMAFLAAMEGGDNGSPAQ